MSLASRARAAVLAVDRLTTRIASLAACFALALAAGIACFQIVMRYVVRQSTTWSEPVLQMAVIYMVYLGAAVTFRRGALVAIDLLQEKSRGRFRQAINLFLLLAALTLIGHMIWYGYQMTLRAQFNVNPTLGISMSWGFAAIPIGGLFAAIAVIAHYLDPPPREIDTGS